MENFMSWWLILIVIIAGIGSGFLISNLILRRQDKGFSSLPDQASFSAPAEKPKPPISKPAILTVEKSQPAVSKPAILSVEPFETKPVEKRQKPAIMAEETLEKFISKSKSPPASFPPAPSPKSTATPYTPPPKPPVPPAKKAVVPPELAPRFVPPAPTPKSAAILELETNLLIAMRPSADKLTSFQTDVWNTRRSDFNAVNSQILNELTEAYVDMLLANNIVWLVNELGRDSQDLRASYSELKIKVADRLKRVLPHIQEPLK
jgi:hypothetical protein